MTTKRMSFQLQQQASHHHHHHQHHHHAQRRPPDVEEALSSMLWTPYERASTTDTSSDDEDEHLQRQLKKSKSQYDYTSVPTTIPPLTPPPPPLLPEPATLPMPLPIPTALALPTTQFPLPPTHLTPTNIVAYITTATPLRAAAQAAVAATSLLTCTPVRTASAATATSSYYTAEDLCDPSVVTPLVPFSNFMLNAHTMTTTTSTTAANNDIDVDQDQDDDDDDDVDGNVDTIVHDINVDDTFNDVVYGNENRLAATSSSLAMMSSSYQQKNRYSSSSSFSTFGRIPSLTKWWSTSSNNTQSNTVSIAAQYDNSNATTQLPPASASTLTDEANKQPPSYESLYNKKQHPLRPQRPQQRHSHHSHYRLNKHLNLFKPVLETLKANVTTITQGRFTSLARPDNNCRVTNNTNNTTTNALNHGPAATLTPILATATTTTATEAMGENSNNSTEESTSNNLVHSFTDNFLHEHCQTTQHVAGTNVAETNVANNEHIINNNNNNNDILTTDNNMNGETPNQSHERLIHQQQQQQQHTHLQESTNTKSKQNQEHEHENKQNNNFIISQQQKQQQQQKQEQLLLTITTNENNENKLSDEQTKMNTKTNTENEQQQQLTTDHREPTMDVFNTTTTTTTTSMIEESGLLYDSSSAISLTRSFEANTSYTFDCTRTNNANSFNKFSYETRKTNDTSSTTTISNTYNLTPNKCLAELERLYAEFRASESIREQKLREHQNIRLQNAHRRNLKDIATETENMRLNVPASNSANAEFNSRNGVGVAKAVSETKLNPSTSSVFLTTTNSLTTITNPCQRTPSLTIQVNQNQHTNSNNTSTNTNTNPSNNNNNNHNNNNNNNNNINNNNVVASATNTGQHDNYLQQQVFLNQAIVNTTTNGVSVINCNYVNNNNNYSNSNSNSNNNNNNNHNKSITNLQDSVTNSKSKSISNPTSTSTSSASSTTNNLNNNHDPATDHIKSNNNHMPGGVSDNIPNSSVPQVLNASDENPPITNSSPLKQVNVIKVNEHVEKRNNSNASTPAQSPRRRTFTSTECQTDDIASVQLRSPSAGRPPLTSTSSANSTGPPHSTTNNREQRRRERRERRHLQHTASLMVAPTHHSHPHPPHPLRHASLMDRHSMPTPPLPPILHPPHLHLQQAGHHNVAMLRPMLPDILHNHFPPPYSALPPPPPPPTVGSGSVPHHHNGSPLTFSHAPPPPTQNATATILGPPPPPPPAGTTLLTSVISTVPIPGATPMVSDGRFTLPLPIMRRSPSERSGKGCCGQWFAGPPLRALIAVVALGGVACALGGAALGATGLAGPPSSHFTAALLMIGVGVVLVTVSGAAWRMTAPGGPPCLGLGSSVDLGRCGRRPCSRGGGAPQGLLYPEFQHRPPPPSYQASMQEYRLRLLLLDRDRQNGVVRGSSPPPTYRSHAGSLLRAPLTSTIRGTQGHSGGRCESSIGGSEYSFPPSYRSRNTTPGTISSERSIETEPSGRLLANEDIPEPLSVDQLSEYNSLQQRTLNTSNANNQKSEQKRNSIQLDSPDLVTKSEVNLNNLNSSDKKNDLVTIVTITPNSNDIMEVHENCNNVTNGEGYANEDLVRNSESREQIEILAHL